MEKAKIETQEGAYHSTNSLFRDLTADEVQEFRQHARENYVVGTPINDLWHPVYREECQKMNEERANAVKP